MDQPLPPLGKHSLGTAIALDTMHTGQVPDIGPMTVTGRRGEGVG
jgi:hypothetical protein